MLRRLICILFPAFLLLSAFPAAAEEAPVLLPILMYHDVKWQQPGKDVITPAELESDLRRLRELGYTAVTMADAEAYVYEGVPLPPKPVILSFDDGFLSAETAVLPLLRKYGTPIVLSPIGRSADDFSKMPGGSRYAHATWAQLREMADSGLAELQNHTYDLHRAGAGVYGCERKPGETCADYERRLSEDALHMQERVYAETGRVPSVFVYPYGRYCDLSEAVLRELGFRATLTCDFGINELTRDPDCLFGLRRICRSHGANLDALLAEAAETLKWR